MAQCRSLAHPGLFHYESTVEFGRRDPIATAPGSNLVNPRSFLYVTNINTTITAAITSEEITRLKFNPPSAYGFVNVSPSVAGSPGRAFSGRTCRSRQAAATASSSACYPASCGDVRQYPVPASPLPLPDSTIAAAMAAIATAATMIHMTIRRAVMSPLHHLTTPYPDLGGWSFPGRRPASEDLSQRTPSGWRRAARLSPRRRRCAG